MDRAIREAMLGNQELDRARDLVSFIEASPTPYHAVAEVTRRLGAAGFVELDEREPWELRPGMRAFVVRDGSVIAFVLGHASPARTGFVLIGAHTDSPNLKIKPVPHLTSVGFQQLAVEVYGGVLLSTWLDRDLGIAGRITARDGSSFLVRTTLPVCKIPNLAIHLNREVNSAGLLLNPQLHLTPTLALETEGGETGLFELIASDRAASGHALLPGDILGFDLSLYDVQSGAFGGRHAEFIYSARIDNLASCHAATEALIASGLEGEQSRVIALYDHEEVGSQSATGARSLLLHNVLDRLALAYPDSGKDATTRALARSLLVSVDMAHATHPNYADRHDKNHNVRLGRGPVIKTNVNQSYATDGVSSALFRAACEKVGLSPQYFVSRNDMPCGSTIGPITAARLAVRTVDVGNPMLSMHSCREMAAARDVLPMIGVLTSLLTGDTRLPLPPG